FIKKWLLRPLVKKETIVQRQDAIEECVLNVSFAQRIGEVLTSVGDIERVIGRIALRRGQLQDYLQLAQALQAVPTLKIILQDQKVPLLAMILEYLQDFSALSQLLMQSLNDDISKPWIIKE